MDSFLDSLNKLTNNLRKKSTFFLENLISNGLERPWLLLSIVTLLIWLIPTLWVTYQAERFGFQDKVLWDWLELLVIPIAFAATGYVLNQAQKQRDIRRSQQNLETDRQIAKDNQRQSILESYMERISNLLIKEGLRDAAEDDEVSIAATAMTLTTIRRLDSERNKQVIKFLRDASLMDTIIKLKRVNIPHTNFRGVNLEGANLAGANLNQSMLKGANLKRTNLEGTQFFQANLEKADLHEAKLTRANLTEAQMQGANLWDCWMLFAFLKDANLTNARLNFATLNESELSKANLSHANLTSACLQKTNLESANLSNAVLVKAILQSTFLRSADLTDADLTDADLTGADLTDAIITVEQILSTKHYDEIVVSRALRQKLDAAIN